MSPTISGHSTDRKFPSSKPTKLMSVTIMMPSQSFRYAICSFATSSLDMLHSIGTIAWTLTFQEATTRRTSWRSGAAGFSPSPGAAGSACAILPCMEIIEAEFENGVLRPMRRLSLRPGERVGIVVMRRPDPARWDLDRLSKVATGDDEALAAEGLDDWAAALDREDRR